MPHSYRASLSSGIYGAYTAAVDYVQRVRRMRESAQRRIEILQDDEKEAIEPRSQSRSARSWDWSQTASSSSQQLSINTAALAATVKETNFRVCGGDDDDDDEKVFGASYGIRDKDELSLPSAVKQESNYAELKHASGEQCNIFPVPSVSGNDASRLISFTLDLNADHFCQSKMDSFLNGFADAFGLDRANLDIMCVNAGSSIVWVKINETDESKLLQMASSFAKPTEKINTFVSKFKVDIKKTVDTKGAKFRKVIDTFQSKKSNSQQISSWLSSQVSSLYPMIYKQLRHCHYDFEIVDCMVVDVEQRINAFTKYADYKNAKLLFHGTATSVFAGIISNGFWINKGSIGKWYGIGAYFTSFPVYAMEYYCMKQGASTSDPNLCITLIGSLVNTGNAREIYEKHPDEPIASQYDCNHVRVYGTGSRRFGPVSQSQWNHRKTSKEKMYDEWAIRESTRILPRYLIKLKKIEKVFIWRNTSFDQYPNAPIYEDITKQHVVYLCKDDESAIDLIKLKHGNIGGASVYVISNSRNGKQFIVDRVIGECGIPKARILVFCGYVAGPKKEWADSAGVEVTGRPDRVKEFVKGTTRTVK